MALSPMGPEWTAGSLPGSLAERRASLRFQWKGTASVRILPDGPDVLGVLLDVSEEGCGIELGMAIPAQVGAKVKVDLRVQGLSKAGIKVIMDAAISVVPDRFCIRAAQRHGLTGAFCASGNVGDWCGEGPGKAVRDKTFNNHRVPQLNKHNPI